ncbi:MAG: SMC-Scp complex subunit ScpB [Chloroflexi bacterium]|nr:SMC-Scp complex subunit ScpB [Chloroflexota bacterium]
MGWHDSVKCESRVPVILHYSNVPTGAVPERGTGVEHPPDDVGAHISDLVAILFVAGESARRGAVQRALGISSAQLAILIDAARRTSIPGLLIQEHGDLLRLVTHPETAASLRRFVQAPSAIRLSAAAVETLAVIAYTQPTTRAQVQEARGVSSDTSIATLLQHGLIAEAGRAEGHGRPILLATTPECLALLGVASLDELPTLRPPTSSAGRDVTAELPGELLL